MGRPTFIFVSNLFVYSTVNKFFSKYLFTAFALIFRMAMLLGRCHAEDLKLVCCHI